MFAEGNKDAKEERTKEGETPRAEHEEEDFPPEKLAQMRHDAYRGVVAQLSCGTWDSDPGRTAGMSFSEIAWRTVAALGSRTPFWLRPREELDVHIGVSSPGPKAVLGLLQSGSWWWGCLKVPVGSRQGRGKLLDPRLGSNLDTPQREGVVRGG